MSTNLHARFSNYLDLKRLKRDGSFRINKALLKYGHYKFSVTILELTPTNITGLTKLGDHLRRREDFFIKTFKAQYNIKRYMATRDVGFKSGKKSVQWIIPLRIKTLLDKWLDPEQLDYNLLRIEFYTKQRLYWLVALTPKGFVHADSSGWIDGRIAKKIGWVEKERGTLKTSDPLTTKRIIGCKEFVDNKLVQELYQDKEKGYVTKLLNKKHKALIKAMVEEEYNNNDTPQIKKEVQLA